MNPTEGGNPADKSGDDVFDFLGKPMTDEEKAELTAAVAARGKQEESADPAAWQRNIKNPK